MKLPVIAAKSEIKTIAPQLIEVQYERRIVNRVLYWVKKLGDSSLVAVFFLIAVSQDLESWRIGIYIIIILMYIFSSFISSFRHDVKFVKITPQLLTIEHFSYFKSDLNKSLENLDYLDFEVNIYDDGSTVAVQNVEIPLYDVASFPVLIDAIAEMLNLEYTDTVRLSDDTEILTYKSKTVSQIDFPSFLKIETKKNSLTIADIYEKKAFLKVDNLNKKYQFSKYGTLMSSGDLTSIDKVIIRFTAKQKRGNSYLEILFLINGKLDIVFKTIEKSIEHELSTIRDTQLLFDTFAELDFAKVELENIKLLK